MALYDVDVKFIGKYRILVHGKEYVLRSEVEKQLNSKKEELSKSMIELQNMVNKIKTKS